MIFKVFLSSICQNFLWIVDLEDLRLWTHMTPNHYNYHLESHLNYLCLLVDFSLLYSYVGVVDEVSAECISVSDAVNHWQGPYWKC